VDVTVERRLLGWIAIHTESVADVIHSKRVAEDRLTGGGVSKHRGSFSDELVLTPRHGPEWHSPLCTPSFGTRPKAMAGQIDEFHQRILRPIAHDVVDALAGQCLRGAVRPPVRVHGGGAAAASTRILQAGFTPNPGRFMTPRR
jgi:hypothetical protein